jgi:hypothetical protein
MKKKLVLLTLVIAAIFSLSACAGTDVVGDQSIKSFEGILAAMPDKVNEDEMNDG